MSAILQKYLKEFRVNSKKRHQLLYIICLLSCVVAGCVFWQLRMVGITMTDEACCGKLEHVHTEECVADRTLICGREEGVQYDDEAAPHHHTDACYKVTYNCGKEEHVHTLACYSDPKADVETADVWKRTLPKTLTGDWPSDVVAVAKSQCGYKESTRNYQVAEDGETKKGYTRYGAWYGNPYGDWSTMFVSFCMQYAGIPKEAVPQEAGAFAMQKACTTLDIAEKADYAPQPGDVVFIRTPESTHANRTAIVTEAFVDDSQTPMLRVIQGDVKDEVVERTLKQAPTAPEDEVVEGYINMAKAVTVADAKGIVSKMPVEPAPDTTATTEKPVPDADVPTAEESAPAEEVPSEKTETIPSEEVEPAPSEEPVPEEQQGDTVTTPSDEQSVTDEKNDPQNETEDQENKDTTVDINKEIQELFPPTENLENTEDDKKGVPLQPLLAVTPTNGPVTYAMEEIAHGASTEDLITINLFDYDTLPINKNHDFKFVGNGLDDSKEINQWTGKGGGPRLGILEDELENGFPVVAEKSGEVQRESLSYLFDPAQNNAKTTRQNLDKLFIKDEDTGYYTYNSNKNFASIYDSNGNEDGNFHLYAPSTYAPVVADPGAKFMPFNQADALNDQTANWHFGMTVETEFVMPKDGTIKGEDMTFGFVGDDDLWVFIDNQLVLDLGGVHDRVGGEINFAKGTVGEQHGYINSTQIGSWQRPLWPGVDSDKANGEPIFPEKFKTNSRHTIKIFYLERGGGASNCSMRFNLPPVATNSLAIEKQLVKDGEYPQGINDFVANLDYTFKIVEADSVGNPTETSFIPENKRIFDLWENGEPTERQKTVADDGTFTLKPNQAAIFPDILAYQDKQYIVQEIIPNAAKGQYNGADYELEGMTGQAGKGLTVLENSFIYQTPALKTDASGFVRFRNKLNVTNLSQLQISKEADPGIVPPTSDGFPVKVTVNGKNVPDGTSFASNQSADIKTAQNGIVHIKAGETLTMQTGLLVGDTFTVQEVVDESAGYKPSYSGTITAGTSTTPVNVATGTSATGTIAATQSVATMNIHNAFKEGARLEITKTINDADELKEKDFPVEVKIDDKPLSKGETFTVYDKNGDIKGTRAVQEEGRRNNKKYTVLINDGETLVRNTPLPDGATVWVKEHITTSGGWYDKNKDYDPAFMGVFKDRDGKQIGIFTDGSDYTESDVMPPDTKIAHVDIVNSTPKEGRGSFSLTKALGQDTNVSDNTEFEFTIQLAPNTVTAETGILEKYFPIQYTNEAGKPVHTSGIVQIQPVAGASDKTAGQITVKLYPGETVLLKHLPLGTPPEIASELTPTITENEANGYEVTWQENGQNKGTGNSYTATPIGDGNLAGSVTCTNTKTSMLTGDSTLEIKKYYNYEKAELPDNEAARAVDFKVHVTLNDKPLPAGTELVRADWATGEDTSEKRTVDEYGNVMIHMDETLRLKNVPNDASFKVTEVLEDPSSYGTSFTGFIKKPGDVFEKNLAGAPDSISGTMPGEACTAHVDVINTDYTGATGNLSLTKQITNGDDTDKNQEFKFMLYGGTATDFVRGAYPVERSNELTGKVHPNTPIEFKAAENETARIELALYPGETITIKNLKPNKNVDIGEVLEGAQEARYFPQWSGAIDTLTNQTVIQETTSATSSQAIKANDTIKVTCTNAVGTEKLPETGGFGTGGYTVAGLALMGSALTALHQRRRRKEREGPS